MHHVYNVRPSAGRRQRLKNQCLPAVVRRGEIVEEGSHAELVRVPAGAYSTLVRLQQQRAAAGEDDVDSLVRTVTVRVESQGRDGH